MIKKTLLLVSCAILLAACSSYGTTPTPGTTQTPATGQVQVQGLLTIANFTFSPSSLTVKAGEIVTINNNDSVPHTVTSDDGVSFSTMTINPGSSATFTAPTKAGSYAYHCNIHKSMTGTIVVQ